MLLISAFLFLSCVSPGEVIFTREVVSDLWFDTKGGRIYMLPIPITASGSFKVGDREFVVCELNFPVERIRLGRRFSSPDQGFIEKVKEEKERIKQVYMRRTEKKWSGDFILPVRRYKRLKDNFGMRREINGSFAGFHRGIDISARPGTRVFASNSGEVVIAGRFTLEGNLVIIDHGSGIFSIYAHLRRIYVKEGEFVRKGQVIGEVGRTGRATGPHLHFGIKFGDVDVNPFFMFDLTRKLRRFISFLIIPDTLRVSFSS